MQCILNSVGIECKVISGSTSKQRDTNHAWNQVKIDDKWYNVDLTWDRDNFEEDMLIENCLVSDEEFVDHHPMMGEYEECMETYDRNILENSVINNLSPINRLKFMMLQKEQNEKKEKTKIDETELKPWDLKRYSNGNLLKPENKIQKRKEDDEIER